MVRGARVAAWAAWAVPFAVYAASLSGAVGYWDVGEAQTVPWIFGIMHPTGFPVFTIAAGLFAHLFAVGAVSWRIALFSALATSGAAWLIARCVLVLDGEPWIAAAAAWVFAFGYVSWTRGTRAEVHTLALFFSVLTLYYAVRWYRNGERRTLIAGAFAWGLAIATHPIAALLAPGLLVLFLVRVRRVPLRAFALAVLALCAGVAFYAYLPVRSAVVTRAHLDPTRQLGLAPGKAFWDMNHPASWAGFEREVSGKDFLSDDSFDPQAYGTRVPVFFLRVLLELTPLCVLLALGALYALARDDRPLALALVLSFALPGAFGLTYTIEADPSRYDLISFAVSAILAGYGACAIVRALPPLRAAVTTLVMAMAVTLLLLNRQTFAQPGSHGAQAVITTVREKTPRDAVLIATWLYATPLAYAAYVDRRLDDRIVVCAWLADEKTRVPIWARTRPIYVVGTLFGRVKGYRTSKIAGFPTLYRLIKTGYPSAGGKSPLR